MEDGVAAKRNQRKVAEELKQLIKAVKDTYTKDNDAELEQRINRTRQAEALEQMGNVFEEATEGTRDLAFYSEFHISRIGLSFN